MPRWACILLAVALVGCERRDEGQPPPATEPAVTPIEIEPFSIAAPDVVLLITGGTHGRLELCNCPDTLPGGLSRRSGLVASYRAAWPNTLVMDTGDVFSYDPGNPQNRYVLRGYRMIGYDAVVLGDHEWSALAGPLEAILRAAPMKYLSTSAVADGSDLPLVREVVHQAGATKLAVLSYLGADTLLFTPAEARSRLKLENIAAVSRRAGRLKAEGCVVVLAAHVTELELPSLAELESVDLVMQANTRVSSPTVGKLGDALLIKVGGPGHVGALAAKIKNGRIAQAELRLEVVTKDWPLDWRLLDLYQAYAHEAMRAELDRRRTDELAYVGSETCGACHQGQYRSWKQGPHSHAWTTLTRAGRADESDCAMCHVSGLALSGGFRSIGETPALANVNCQDCHRFNQAEHGEGKARPPVPGKKTCTTCHTPVTSPKFDFAEYYRRIGCVVAGEGGTSRPVRHKP